MLYFFMGGSCSTFLGSSGGAAVVVPSCGSTQHCIEMVVRFVVTVYVLLFSFPDCSTFWVWSVWEKRERHPFTF